MIKAWTRSRSQPPLAIVWPVFVSPTTVLIKDPSCNIFQLLRHLNTAGDADEHHIIQLLDYFYFKEHLFLVFELLRDDLYEFSNFNRESNGELYFTASRLRSIARCVIH